MAIKQQKSNVAEQASYIKMHKKESGVDLVEFLPSGSTNINLAGSGKGKRGGWARGRIANIVGDNSTGKTALAVEALAQSFYNIHKIESQIFAPVKKVYLVYNNVEGVMDLPLETMYRRDFIDSVEWIQTSTVEAFGRDYGRRVMALKEGEFLFYVIDTFDALRSEEGIKRLEQSIKTDKQVDGSYNMEKQKYGADFFAWLCDISQGKDVTLMILSQVKDKIGVTFGKKHYRGGGKHLDYYSHQIAWLSEIEKKKRTFRKEERVYAIRCRAKFEKNKVAKPYREGEFTVLFDYGLDDISGMIDWLYGPEVKKMLFDDEEFDRAGLIKYIEDNRLQEVLMDMCEQEWIEIEQEIAPTHRAPRFQG